MHGLAFKTKLVFKTLFRNDPEMMVVRTCGFGVTAVPFKEGCLTSVRECVLEIIHFTLRLKKKTI